ncbi:MAG: HD domain-containing protein, partial [Treponema sp.]|nr:HD domain-containing protein [Treponema sp.]
MNNYKIKEIPPDSYFSKPVYLDDAFIIAAPEMPFSGGIASLLEKWKFDEVLSEGEPHKDYAADSGKSGSIVTENVSMFSQQSDSDKLEKAIKFYVNFISYVEKMFMKVAKADEFDYREVVDKIKDMVDYIKDDRRFLMRVLKNVEADSDKNYLAIHSVRSTILSIIIGTYLKLPNHRLMELGVAALMHEAGMLKIPQNIYLSDKALTPPQQKAILAHPILGYNLLKSFNFPLAVCLAALEHHERENGTG